MGARRLAGDQGRVRSLLREHEELVRAADALVGEVARAAQLVASALRRGRKVLLCGNGGSAADAQHIAAELVGRFRRERRGLPAVALTADTSVVTALGNDYGFEEVFARQVDAAGQQGDVLVALSTSGNSRNVLRACEMARTKGLRVIGLTGADGGQLKSLCDICLCVSSRDTARVQEVHILLAHIICELVETALCSSRQ